MENNKWGPILIGFAYLVLVVFIMQFCAAQSDGFDEFSKYWGLFGTLIGVATGSIPTFFFKTQADKATARADKANNKANALAGVADAAAVQALRESNADLFK